MEQVGHKDERVAVISVGISAINQPYPVGVNLQIGRDVYVDRGYIYTTVPSLVQGASYIQTANNDKASSGDGFLTFTLDQPSIVYVAYDVRISLKPQWLSAFTDTGEELVTSDTTLQLLSQSFPAGPVSLGGNESSGKSMYALAIVAQPEPVEDPVPDDTISYPQIMGMAIGSPSSYCDETFQAQIARCAVSVVGFYRGWNPSGSTADVRGTVQQIKARNPALKLAQYTILNEAFAPGSAGDPRPEIGQKIEAEGWWVRNASGEKVQWTPNYNKWDVNSTVWMPKDAQGKRYSEWLAELNYFDYFRPIPEYDICYLDNALSKPASPLADWDGDGADEANTDTDVSIAYRLGNRAHWGAVKSLNPGMPLIGNSDDLSSPEYSKQLHGCFLEALIGKSWSMEGSKGWAAMMDRYRKSMAHSLPPHYVGFNVWGAINDYQRMRYGLCSCLLDDGYFSYTDEAAGYSAIPWFDEYDAVLGQPIEPPKTQPIKGSFFWNRKYENGIIYLNPTATPSSIKCEPGYRRIEGTQAPDVNTGSVAGWVNLGAKDGIVLVKA